MEFRAAVAEATFLFDSDITDYLGEIDTKAVRLNTMRRKIGETPPVANRGAVAAEYQQLLA